MASSISWPDKDPHDLLDFALDWAAQMALATPADSIVSVLWIVPDALTVSDQAHSDTLATVWLGGGTDGTRYTITCRVTTAAGRVIERDVAIKVRNL